MITDKALDRIQEICFGRENVKLTVAIYKDGKTEKRLFGCDGEELPYQSYHYEIGSISKTFVAAVLAKALDEGVVALDDRINKYISELKDGRVYPTLRRLASHTSGYPADSAELEEEFARDLTANPYNKITYSTMLQMIDGIEIEDKDYPANYSNLGVGILAFALGRAYNRPFYELLNELIAELRLDETFIGFDDCFGTDLIGYHPDNMPAGNMLWTKDCIIGPAGYLFSTAEDLLKYALCQINDSTGYLHLSHQVQALYQPHDTTPVYAGLCWIIVPHLNVIFHNGETRCFHTALCINVKEKTAVVMLCNYIIGEISNMAVNLLVDLTRK